MSCLNDFKVLNTTVVMGELCYIHIITALIKKLIIDGYGEKP